LSSEPEEEWREGRVHGARATNDAITNNHFIRPLDPAYGPVGVENLLPHAHETFQLITHKLL